MRRRRIIALILLITYVMTGIVLPEQSIMAAESNENRLVPITHVQDDDIWSAKDLLVYKSMTYYHAGDKSLRLRKENVKSEAYADNSKFYSIPKGDISSEYELTWEAWYRSKNSTGFLRIDITLYDAEKQKIDTLKGNKVMLSRSDTLSEWAKLSTSMNVPTGATYVTFRINVLEGNNQVWVDDISLLVTETYEYDLVEYSDFYGKTEEGKLSPWVKDEDTLLFESNNLIPQYAYHLQILYLADKAGMFGITYYDSKRKVIKEESVTFDASDGAIMSMETTAPNCTYASIWIKGTNFQINEFALYCIAYEGEGKNGWQANIVWYPEDPKVDAITQGRYFRSTFQIEKEVESIYLQEAADDDTWGTVFFNCTDKKVYSQRIDSKQETGKRTAYVYDLTSRVRLGKNVLAIRAHNANSVAGLVFEIYINYVDGTSEVIYSNAKNVKVSKLNCLNEGDLYKDDAETPADWYQLNFDDSDWVSASDLGVPPYTDMKVPAFIYGYAPRTNLYTGEAVAEKIESGVSHTTSIAFTKVEHRNLAQGVLEGQLYKGDELIAHLTVQMKLESEVARFTYCVPDYLPSGEYRLKLREDGLGIINAAEDNVICNISLQESDHKAGIGCIEQDDGVVRLKVNGNEVSPVMYLRPHHTKYYYNYENLSVIKEGEIVLYSTYNGHFDGRDGAPIWTDEDTIDFAAFDGEIYRTLDLNSDAMLIVNIATDAPQWWLDANPSECLTDEDGNIVTITSGSEKIKKVSFASEKYREEASEIIKKLVEHMQTASYRNRVCGVRLIGGRTFEWMQYNSDDETGTHPEIDYSQAMKDSFYKATGYEVPSTVERSQGKYQTFIDPATQKDVLTYNEYLSQCVTDSLLTYAKVVKDVMPQWLVGAYYGYLWFESSSLGIGGCHTTVEQILDSPYIDFIASPVNYSERIKGYKTGYMALAESIAAHGKLYMLEQDNRTLYSDVSGEPTDDNAVGYENTMEGSINQLTRDMSTNLVKGTGCWFYDMEGGWFSDKQLTDVIRRLKNEYDHSLNSNMQTNSEVAVYVSSRFYNQLSADLLNGKNGSCSHYLIYQLYNMQRLEFAKMGTSYDTYMIEDLCNEKVDVAWEDYKLHIMLSPIEITDGMRSSIEKKLKKNGNVILWIYLPGISDGLGFSDKNMSALIDMDVSLITGKSMRLTGTISNETFGSIGEAYGADFGYSYQTPYAVVEDDAAISLATYTQTGEVAAAIKACKDYVSVYSGVSNVGAESLRKLCNYAGVHLYSEDKDTVIETNASYISVYSQIPGYKKINLDGKYTVYDVFNDEIVGENISEFTVCLNSGETALYRLFSSIQVEQITDINLSKVSLFANGKKQTVSVQVRDRKGELISPENYIVSGVLSATKPGTYQVTVTMKGTKYQGSKTLTWKILLKGASLKAVKGGSKRLVIKWKKQTLGVTGYKVQVSTSKNFKKNLKTVIVKKAKKSSLTIKKLKAKKRYYVRICTYKDNYKSAWSKVKSAKTKK